MNFFTQKKWKTKRLLVFLLMLFCCKLALGQSRPVTGKIIDALSGEPVIGASVLVVGSSAGIAADINGTFKINVPDGGSLEFKSVGYVSVIQKADFGKPMIIKLSPDNKGLSEVVVIGYGEQK